MDDQEEYEDPVNESMEFFEELKEEMHKAISKRKYKEENIRQQIINMRDMLKELGQDMLDTSVLVDNYIKFIDNPIAMSLDNNLDKTLDKMANEINMRMLITCSKMTAFVELTKNEEGDEENE